MCRPPTCTKRCCLALESIANRRTEKIVAVERWALALTNVDRTGMKAVAGKRQYIGLVWPTERGSVKMLSHLRRPTSRKWRKSCCLHEISREMALTTHYLLSGNSKESIDVYIVIAHGSIAAAVSVTQRNHLPSWQQAATDKLATLLYLTVT